MTRTFKVLSLLLTYPTAELQMAAPALRAALAEEGLVPATPLSGLGRLLGELETADLYDLQERYVLLFDRTRSLSLHLFEHVYGESRDRGSAMLDLAEHYKRHGLEIGVNELPDFLPLFLEFLSTLPLDAARDWLAQTLHVIVALKQRLRKRKSPYASVFWAIESLAEAKPSKEGLNALRIADDDDPDDLEALDKAWEDAPVTFGPGSGGDACSRERLISKVRAGMRPAPDVNPLPHR